MTRDELIAALEKATGPDRELDAYIGTVAGWAKTGWASNRWWPADVVARARKAKKSPSYFGAMPLEIPKFTASIDAALTLYVRKPERVPSNPRLACIAALKARPE